MSRISAPVAARVVWLALAGPLAPDAIAQLVPPAGSAGAGSSAISGVPSGPANPSVLSDPSGIGNAGRMPQLGTNAPAPPTSYGSVTSAPEPSRSRVVTPSFASESPVFGARSIEPRKLLRRHRRAQTSSFTGICRGCWASLAVGFSGTETTSCMS